MILWYQKPNIDSWLEFQSQIEDWPVVGYAEKNEPRTLETPRPNNCSKISRRIVRVCFFQQNKNLSFSCSYNQYLKPLFRKAN